MQVKAACLILAALSIPASASWIFPDQRQQDKNNRYDETRHHTKRLSLLSGQPLSPEAPRDLKLLHHHLQAQGNNSKVPRSLDIHSHTRPAHPPSDIFISHVGSPSPQFSLSPASRTCCTGSGFKPSTFYTLPAPSYVHDVTYKSTTITTRQPIHIFNAINIYKPTFNSQIITTHKSIFRDDDVTFPSHQFTHTTTTTSPTTPTPAHNSLFNPSDSTGGKPGPGNHIYFDPDTIPPYTEPSITTYRPKYGHKHIPYYEPSSATEHKSPSPEFRQVNINKSHYLPRRDDLHSTNTLKPGRQARGYNFGYEVSSRPHGTFFGHQEHSDGGVVRGQYRVRLPDGRLQVVTYTAGGEQGFRPVVTYEPAAPPATTFTHFQPPA